MRHEVVRKERRDDEADDREKRRDPFRANAEDPQKPG
jgi:hypothetical protein